MCTHFKHRSNAWSSGVHPLQVFHPPRYKAGQLPDGHRAALQQAVHDRLRAREEVPRHTHPGPHLLPRGQEPHW